MNAKLPLISIVFLWLCSVSAAVRSDELDSPIKKTARTEIQRGGDVSYQCAKETSYQVIEFSDCIDNAYNRQAQQGTLTDPFALGLYFMAALEAEIGIDVGYHAPKSRAKLIHSIFQLYASEITTLEQSLKLSDETVADVLGMNEKGIASVNIARSR